MFRLDDPAFLSAFEGRKISRADWTHRAQVKAASLQGVLSKAGAPTFSRLCASVQGHGAVF